MAIRDDLIEALNACIERSHAGESLELILQDYPPEMAQSLQLLMAAGQTVKRGRFQSSAIEQVRLKSEPQIRDAINSLPSSGAGFSLNIWFGLLIGGGILLGLIFNIVNQNTPVASPSQETLPSGIATEVIATRASDEPSEESFAVTETATLSPDSIITVVEGPVESISGNSIFIYGVEIVLEANDPNLTVIQVGDIIRAEGLDDGNHLLIISIVFTSVEVYIYEGMVWRDSGDCSNPPPAWATASAWHQRCEGGAPPISSGGTILPDGCRYTGMGRGVLIIKCSHGGQ